MSKPLQAYANMTPIDIPNLISFWDFNDGGRSFTASQGEAYTLQTQTSALSAVDDHDAPFGGTAIRIDEGQWLNIPRADCPRLDFHGPHGQFTLIAWIKRHKTQHNDCEFIAGQWNESNLGRQYGLFLNISVWGQNDGICAHLSRNGGPTPCFQYCMDGAFGGSVIDHNQWHAVAMSYDGHSGYAWLDGALDIQPGLNPYLMPGGLHDGGADGSDFTVGAVDRSGEIGNFFCGHIAGLAVYNRVLTPAELTALAQM